MQPRAVQMDVSSLPRTEAQNIGLHQGGPVETPVAASGVPTVVVLHIPSSFRHLMFILGVFLMQRLE